MTKKIKHPQHILVIDKEFTDELPGMALKHGVTRFNTEAEYSYWLDIASAHLMTGLREKMEYDPRFRQILPYTPVVFSDTPDNIDWANAPLFLYQRTKKVGEERLAGNYSIGLGGHVDNDDVMTEKSIVDFPDTVNTNLEREVATEELDVTTVDNQPIEFKTVPYGLIRDDSNNVGKVHLGVVNVIVLPTSAKAKCVEAELITCEPKSATELKASGLNFEGWTQILIDAFLDVPCSVVPAVRRDVQYDLLGATYFIMSKKGDKWTELAIEFNATAATLYRLNMIQYATNDIDEGTRINVPDQPDQLVKVETPQSLIDALNNDTERARAKAKELVGRIPPTEEGQAEMTNVVLRGILAQGPDYANCGLIFLVTQEMADRLIALDAGIRALVDAGVVSIVEQSNLPGNAESLAVDPETAAHVKEGSVVWHMEDTLDPTANAGAPGEVLERGQGIYLEMPNPTDVDLQSPLFEAIWQAIKGWDVNVPERYNGYCGANGSHAKIILDSILTKGHSDVLYVKEGAINVTGDLVTDEESGFRRQVLRGEENGTARHVLENGDSFVSICEKYGIDQADFERWNGFEGGHVWPTHTGYVFVADPSITQHEEPTL